MKSRAADCRAPAPRWSWADRALEKRCLRCRRWSITRAPRQGSGHIRRVRRAGATDRRQCGHLRVGCSSARQEEAVFSRCAALAGRRQGRRVRSDRDAQQPARQVERDSGDANRVRRHRCAARAARRPGGRAPRALPRARLAGTDRAHRDHHAEGRFDRSRPALWLHAVHGRLRGRTPAPGGGRIGLPQSSRHEVPRLRLCRR